MKIIEEMKPIVKYLEEAQKDYYWDNEYTIRITGLSHDVILERYANCYALETAHKMKEHNDEPGAYANYKEVKKPQTVINYIKYHAQG